jgi:SAM-dependent methyltransferase
MFSYIFMRILEARPRCYDRRLKRISRGHIQRVKEEVAAQVSPGSKVLEIGCGTGELAAMLIGRGCIVEAFDLSPRMVATASERLRDEKRQGKFAVRTMGVDGMDVLPEQTYDALVSMLVFSELSRDERRFALRHAARGLKPGGRLVIADEVRPRTAGWRALHALVRLPLSAAAYLITGFSTHPVEDLAGEISSAGLCIEKEVRTRNDSFALIVARRKTGRIFR